MASKWNKRFWVDLGEREVATGGAAVVTVLTATGTDVAANDPKTWWTLVGLPVVLIFLKGVVANATSGSAASPSASMVDVSSNPA